MCDDDDIIYLNKKRTCIYKYKHTDNTQNNAKHL